MSLINGFWIPAFLIIISLPLILGVVPPNHVYGFRTNKTLSDEKIWYKANKDCAFYFLASGVFLFLYLFLERFYPVLQKYFAAAIPIVIIFAVIASLIHIKKIRI